MHRATGTVIVLLAVSGLSACGSTTDPTSEAATFTISPNPGVATQSTDGKTYTIVGDDTHPDKIIAYPWKTTFTVTMEETVGVGRDIKSMAVKVQQASGGIVITPTGSDIEHYDYTSHASGSRLEAKGKASVTFDVWYDLPNKGREALVTVAFSFTDDNDSSFSESTSVQVQ
jgi:hypothetical protein